MKTVAEILSKSNVEIAAALSHRTAADILSAKAPPSSNPRVNEILGIEPVKASGTHESVLKAWETRHANDGFKSQDTARNAAREFARSSDAMAGIAAISTHHRTEDGRHFPAVEVTGDARHEKHMLARLDRHGISHAPLGNSMHAIWHNSFKIHGDEATKASDATLSDKVTATEPEAEDAITARATGDVVHCRAASDILGAIQASDKPWKQGEETRFMYMPAGQHTICAGFRGHSVLLTVNIDPERDTQVVQASFQKLVSKYPKQKPFGCIEHEEKDASVWAKGFEAQADGIYLAAEPSALGENHVNGKIHRSWSPSFLTDADYKKAVLKEYPSGKVYEFPDGVRGSEQNPARITGVTFCVGTLTNNPAFKEIDPVRAKEMATTMNTEQDKITAAQGAFAPGHPFYGNKYSQQASKASFQANVHKDVRHHREAAEAHHQAARDHMKLSGDHAIGTEEHAAHIEAVDHHLKEMTKHAEKATGAASKYEPKEVTTKNEGYGFHGAATDSHRHATAKDADNPTSDERTLSEAAGHKAFSQAANDLVEQGHFDSHNEARDFLDSRIGRHLGDAAGHDTSVKTVSWLKSAVKDYKKSLAEGTRATDTASDPDKVTATWSDAAREAAAAAKRSKAHHGLEGAKFEESPEYFRKWAAHHEGMAEHHEEALRLQPTDKREEDGHREALEMHDNAAKHYRKASDLLHSGARDSARFHLGRAERYSIDAKSQEPDSETIRANSPRTVDAILAGAKPGNQNAAGPHKKHAQNAKLAADAALSFVESGDHKAASEYAHKATHHAETSERNSPATKEGRLSAADAHESASSAHLGVFAVTKDKEHEQAHEYHRSQAKKLRENPWTNEKTTAKAGKVSVEEILKKTSCNPKGE